MKAPQGLFEDMTRFATGMAGTAMEMRREMERYCQQQIEKLLRKMEFVSREEFEVVRAMAVAAREENAQLKARLDAMQAASSGAKGQKPGLDDFVS